MPIASRIDSSGNFYINGMLNEGDTFSTQLGGSPAIANVTFGTVPLNSATANGYTVEFFVKFKTLPTSGGSSFGSSQVSQLNLVANTSAMRIVNSGFTQAGDTVYRTFANDVWYHFAYIGRNDNTYIAIDGQVTNLNSIGGVVGYTATGTWPDGWLRLSGNAVFSNFRVVTNEGGNVYDTTGFTPPTAPLTAIANTKILTLIDSTFVDASGTGTTVTAVSSRPKLLGDTVFIKGVSQRSTPTGILQISNIFDEVTNNPAAMGSLLFDGTTGYISAPDSVNLQLSTGDFTVEGWFYLNALGAVRGIVAKGTSTTGWEVRVTAANLLAASFSSTAITGTTTVTTNRWHYFAFVRSGVATGNIKLYLNGTLEATSATAITTDFTQTNVLAVGTSRLLTSQFFSGNICNVRILKGTALYTAAFTPPIEPPTAVTNTQFLLNPQNTGNIISDTSPNYATLTTVGTVTSSLQTPLTLDGFYNYSFNGTTDYLSIPANANYLFGTSDFTIEMWVWPSSLAATQGLTVSHQTGGEFQWNLNTSGKPVFALNINNGATSAYSTLTTTSTTSTLSLYTWTHIAAVRYGNTFKIYVNGVADATTLDVTGVTVGSFGGNKPIYIGTGADATGFFTGYISNLRIVNGTAVYTANFTPPSEPLTAITNTKLLTCRSNKIVDSSSIGATITRSGSVAVNSNTAPFTTYNYAGSGFAVRRVSSSGISSNGKFQITGDFDEWTGAPVVDSSLKLWWDAGQPSSYSGSGSAFTDLSGNANTGTLNGSPTFDSFIGGGSLLFDGISQTATITTLNLQQDFTLETWVNQNALNGFAMFGQGTGATSQGLHIWYTAAGTIRFGMYGNDTDFTVSTTTGVWYHMVFTYNNSSPYTKGFYLNAVAQSGTAQQAQAAYTGSGVFRLGATYSSGGNYGDGYFQGAKAYNRILTADEVTTNFNALRGRYGL